MHLFRRQSLTRFRFPIIAVATAMILTSAVCSAQTAAESAFDGWTLRGDARLVGGGNILQLDTGVAVAPVPSFTDGTIEFEVQMSGRRAFVYARFRVGSDRSNEEIYLRSHKSHLPDALQYTPVIDGVSQWQIFHGETGTASVALPATEWIKVRLEFTKRKLAVFVGEGTQPAMVIARLALEPRAGAFAFRSFIPGTSDAPFGARIRNVRSKAETSFDFASIDDSQEADTAIVRGWQASPPFAAASLIYGALPEVDDASWRPVATEPDGTVLLHRYGRADGARTNGTVLKLDVEAEKAGIRSLDLGFSDAASVFLNGQPVVSLDASYRFDLPRVQGVMGLHQSRLHLPLKQGSNELKIVVTDFFGGWGIIGRWVGPND